MQHPHEFARSAPDRPAVIMAGSDAASETVLTYAQMDARSNQVAHLLRSLGLTVGDNVAVVMENSTEYFPVVWGGLQSGLRVTPINWHLSAAETRYIVEDCGATVVIASGSCADLVSGVAATRLVVGGSAPGFESYEEARDAQPTSPVDGECEGSWMFYSSGTTGRPKGIRPTSIGGPLGAPNSFTSLVQGLYGGSETTRYLSPAPLYHAAPSGWASAVHRLGGTVLTMPGFDPEAFLAAIERYRVTLAQVVPTHLVRLLKLPVEVRTRYDLSSLEKLVHAAAPCPPDVKRAVLDWLGPVVYEYYSGSEGAGFCAIGPEEWLAHPGSVGRSLLGAVHIVDELGEELPPRAEGQVWFETPARFEYHGDPEKTAAAFDRHGWSTLGEMGWIDEEGYVYLTDRVSNMIISGGVNIYPREIEDVLVLHEGVADVAVVGVPDPEMGEAVRAVVQPARPPADPDAFAAELIHFCRERIAHFKCPRSVVFVERLPRLETGKIARRLLPREVTT